MKNTYFVKCSTEKGEHNVWIDVELFSAQTAEEVKYRILLAIADAIGTNLMEREIKIESIQFIRTK